MSGPDIRDFLAYLQRQMTYPCRTYCATIRRGSETPLLR